MPTTLDDPVSLLRELVAIPSVNPMGRDVNGEIYLEGRMSEHLVRFFERLGVDVATDEVSPGRANVLGRVRGADGAPVILLDAHQDTVPVEGMTIPPFEPRIDGDRLSGRGACDVKGGMAAMLAAFARLARERPAGAATVIMCCTCDEEATASGAGRLAELWKRGDGDQWWQQRPDLCIVAEPTELDVVVAHRGASRWKIRTTGRACHSSDPTQGVNAIYKMGHVVAALEEYAAGLPKRVTPHPLCGSATLSVGRIEGGVSVNTVPDECTIEIDRRVIPGEDGWEANRDVEAWLRGRVSVDFEMLPPWLVGEALSDEHNGPLADRLLGAIAAVVGPRRKVGVPYGTNGSRFDAAGVPTVVFGPGSIAQAHTKDEWISISQLQQAAEIYYGVCAEAV
jgi:succinyl-diaminopimelate desuccinylase